MPKKREISVEQRIELEGARKANKDKNVENRLKALIMRADGESNKSVGKMCGYHEAYVSQLVTNYFKGGIGAIVENHYPGNRRNMSFAEEEAFLSAYKERAEQGEVIEVSAIKAAYVEKVGHTIGNAQIYYVLARHGWRKIMPRSKHPNKASEEEIEASKKLT